MFGTDPNLDLSAAGDDVELNGERDTIHDFRENLRYTHADNMDAGVHGLGQVARELRLEDWDFFDFLSRDGYFYDQFYITRKMDRLLVNSNWTFGLPKVTNARSRTRRYDTVASLNWAQAGGNRAWGINIRLVEAWLARKIEKGLAPTRSASARLAKDMQRLLAFNVDSEKEVVHINEASYLEAMQNKYGRPWAYYDQILEDLLRDQPSWDVSESMIIGSSRPKLEDHMSTRKNV